MYGMGSMDLIGHKKYISLGPKMSALKDIGTSEGKKLLKKSRSSLG